MIGRWAVPCALLVSVFGCDGGVLSQPDGPPSSIAGDYTLAAVDGAALPCCALPDSASGARVTVLAGTLTLGEAAAEEWVATPAGWMAKSCVHEIPNGAGVDTANVVHMPDGSSYRLPECGDGSYGMVLTVRSDYPDGRSATSTRTTAGKYVWGEDRLRLVGSGSTRGLSGQIVAASGEIGITVQPTTVGPPVPVPPGQTLRFVRAR